MVQSEVRKPVADLDWENLGFQYIQTRCYVQCTYKNGCWSSLSLVDEPYIRIHVAATALHYGQSCFEGLKAFRGKDGLIRLFRPDENAKRLATSAERLIIPEVPPELFLDAVHTAVRENEDFIYLDAVQRLACNLPMSLPFW